MDIKVIEAINYQIQTELEAAELYKKLSEWADDMALESCSNFLIKHSDEELKHMQYAIDFLKERNLQIDSKKTLLSRIVLPDIKINNILDLFEQILEHEKSVTKIVNKLGETVKSLNDEEAKELVDWFKDEQIQEEELFGMFIQDIKDIGLDDIDRINDMIDSTH